MVLDEDRVGRQLAVIIVEELFAKVFDRLNADIPSYNHVLDLCALVVGSPVLRLHTNESEKLSGLLWDNDNGHHNHHDGNHLP